MPPTDITRESRLVSESLTQAALPPRWLPIGVDKTRAPKYFSCSTLVEVSPVDVPVKATKNIVSNTQFTMGKEIQTIMDSKKW